MTSFEHDMAKTFGIGIPEEPTDENIKRVFVYMERCYRQDMRRVTPEEALALGDPKLEYTTKFYDATRFFDDFRENYPLVSAEQVKRLNAGEIVTYRVLENNMTPDAPPNFNFWPQPSPNDLPRQVRRFTGQPY